MCLKSYNIDDVSARIYLRNAYTGHMQDICRTYAGHMQDIYRTYAGHTVTGHIQDIYRTYTGHIQYIYRTYTVHIQDIYRTYTGHIQDILYNLLVVCSSKRNATKFGPFDTRYPVTEVHKFPPLLFNNDAIRRN